MALNRWPWGKMHILIVWSFKVEHFFLFARVNKRYLDLSMWILSVISFPDPSFDCKATKHFLWTKNGIKNKVELFLYRENKTNACQKIFTLISFCRFRLTHKRHEWHSAPFLLFILNVILKCTCLAKNALCVKFTVRWINWINDSWSGID